MDTARFGRILHYRIQQAGSTTANLRAKTGHHVHVNSSAGVKLKKCIHSYTTLWVLQHVSLQRHVCFSQRCYCLIYTRQRGYLQVCKPIYFTSVLFFLKLVLPQKKYIVYKYIKNKVMAIHWFYWCVSQKEMKRFVLITVSPQFPDDDAEINPGIKGSTSRTGPSCGFSEIQGLYIPGLRQESNTKATLYAAWWRRSTKLIFTKSSRSY